MAELLGIMNMTKISYVLAVAGLMAVTACRSTELKPGSPANPAEKQLARQFAFKQTERAKLKYLLFLPQDYVQNREKRWPMILFLHGAGERGDDVWKVATHGPPKYVKDHPDFPFIVVSPQCLENQVWSKDVLLGLLDDITRRYAVDTNRIYVTGLSMGGYGTWDLGFSYPEKFAAIAPVCGGGETISVIVAAGEKAQALKTLGVWAFHGGKDPVVPLQESERLVNLLKHHGAQEAKLTIYPEAGHDVWTETYGNPELYQWLLKHQRNGAATRP
jgi:predicted peptidase